MNFDELMDQMETMMFSEEHCLQSLKNEETYGIILNLYKEALFEMVQDYFMINGDDVDVDIIRKEVLSMVDDESFNPSLTTPLSVLRNIIVGGIMEERL